LFSQIEQTEIFIKNHLSLRAEIRGLKRYDYLEIPENAIREALVNAYVHRDYSNFGRNIKVAVYDDLVNIVSRWITNGLTEADLLQGRSEIRNRVLARVFRELGYIEHWGSGLQRIKQMCEAEKLATPEFLETDFFDVKLYRPVIEFDGGAIGGAIDDSSGAIEDLGGAIEAVNHRTPTEILVLIQQIRKFLIVFGRATWY
jgi:ATP-dependent DNA helicase RecG